MPCRFRYAADMLLCCCHLMLFSSPFLDYLMFSIIFIFRLRLPLMATRCYAADAAAMMPHAIAFAMLPDAFATALCWCHAFIWCHAIISLSCFDAALHLIIFLLSIRLITPLLLLLRYFHFFFDDILPLSTRRFIFITLLSLLFDAADDCFSRCADERSLLSFIFAFIFCHYALFSSDICWCHSCHTFYLPLCYAPLFSIISRFHFFAIICHEFFLL